MSQKNIDGLRSAMDAFNRTGEIDVSYLAPGFEMLQASSIIDTAGAFHGRDALHGSLSELDEAFEDLSFEVERISESPSGEIVAFIHVRGRGRGSGMDIDNHIAHVWTFHDGLATRMVVYEEPAEAIEAAGLTE